MGDAWVTDLTDFLLPDGQVVDKTVGGVALYFRLQRHRGLHLPASRGGGIWQIWASKRD